MVNALLPYVYVVAAFCGVIPVTYVVSTLLLRFLYGSHRR
jgi:hypothetical protein